MILMIRIRCNYLKIRGPETSIVDYSGFLLRTFPTTFEGPKFWDIPAFIILHMDSHEEWYDHPRT